MGEERIIIKIDNEGNISSEVKGVHGPTCLDKIEELLRDIAEIEDMKKTDEYFMEVDTVRVQKNKKKVEIKR
ncbi:MAG TPA: DUF2997 domain-containing protein [Candidatus Atribacteria bacterium]|nr:DUF2997 domain-containing protein [Candidatus Atribacteria bacterium]